MTPPSIFISWTSVTPATGLEAPTIAAPLGDDSSMKAPVAFWPATVLRTHGDLISRSDAMAAVAESESRVTAIQVFNGFTGSSVKILGTDGRRL